MHIEQELLFRQVSLGKEPVSEKRRRQLTEEREMAQQKYMVRFDSNMLSCNERNLACTVKAPSLSKFNYCVIHLRDNSDLCTSRWVSCPFILI